MRNILFLVIFFTTLAMGEIRFWNSSEDWNNGKLENIHCEENRLKLIAPSKDGEFISSEIATTPFDRLVVSWNGQTPGKSYFSIWLRVQTDVWSSWLKVAVWGENYSSATFSPKDEVARVSIDTVITQNKKQAKAFQFKIVFHPDVNEVSPVLQKVAVCYFLKEYSVQQDKMEGYLPSSKTLELIPRSQKLEDREVSGRICSPTSLSMVLEFYGHSFTTKQMYQRVYDNGAQIFGNWPFNTAVAGSISGLEAYVDYYYGVRQLQEKIEQGIPVICSIAFKNGELTGAPISATTGHLVVARGFVQKEDGKSYFVVNDPAAASLEEVTRYYEVSEFAKAWKGWVYIIKPTEKK